MSMRVDIKREIENVSGRLHMEGFADLNKSLVHNYNFTRFRSESSQYLKLGV